MDLDELKKPLMWALIAVVVVVAGGVVAWGYASYRERSLHQAVAPQERAAETHLREALAAPLEPPADQAQQAVAKLDIAVQDINTRLDALRRLDAAPDPQRVAAAEESLGDAARIVRKEADAVRAGIAFRAARKALAKHMRGASSRSGRWVNEAIELKHALDKAYFNYKFALDAFAARLSDVPDQDLAGQVRARIDAALEHATAELARSGRL
jgi:hypothetical protein